MQNRFGIERACALELYHDAPLDPNPKATAEQLRQIFNVEVIKSAFDALKETAQSMQQGQFALVRFLEVQQVMQKQFDEQISKMDQAGDEMCRAVERLDCKNIVKNG